MCSVSAMGDHYTQKFLRPEYQQWPFNPSGAPIVTHPSREEFEALKREVEEMKKILLAAKAYDEDACRVESAFCSQAIADTLRKEATDLAAIAEERAELDRREAGIKAAAKSEVAHLEQRQRRAEAYLAG